MQGLRLVTTPAPNKVPSATNGRWFRASVRPESRARGAGMARKLHQTSGPRVASHLRPTIAEDIVSKLLVFLLVPLAAWGGWATITVEDLPDHLVAGQPVTLTFVVRQHGVRPLDGLKPQLEARAMAGGSVVQANATATAGAGRYTATLTVPSPGAWTITIHSGFGNSRSTLEPIPAVVAATRAPQPVAEAQRGRQLFVAKGCGSCHL